MHENITRSQIFKLAWERAKAHVAGYPTIRASFSAALKAIWGIYRAIVQVDAEQKARPLAVSPVPTDRPSHKATLVGAIRRTTRIRWSCGPTSFNW